IAPSNFGPFAGQLLVGNFGEDDGKINVFDLNTGKFLGYLRGPDGNPLGAPRFEHLWAITPGNGGPGGDRSAGYFAAGIRDEQHGVFGSIRFAGAAGGAAIPAPIAETPLEGGPQAANGSFGSGTTGPGPVGLGGDTLTAVPSTLLGGLPFAPEGGMILGSVQQ